MGDVTCTKNFLGNQGYRIHASPYSRLLCKSITVMKISCHQYLRTCLYLNQIHRAPDEAEYHVCPIWWQVCHIALFQIEFVFEIHNFLLDSHVNYGYCIQILINII
jgi:hypothetical protein